MTEAEERKMLETLARVEDSIKDLNYRILELSSLLDIVNICQTETNKMISEMKTHSN